MREIRQIRVAAAILAAAAMLGSTVAWFPVERSCPVEYSVQVIERQPTFEDVVHVETPLIDELVDWDKVDADTDCLWELLKAAGVEITIDSVLAFGYWAEVQGGPCEVLNG